MDIAEKYHYNKTQIYIAQQLIDLLNHYRNSHDVFRLYCVSERKHINFDFILLNNDKKWDISSLSINPNITLDIVKKYNFINWDFAYLSKNKNITFEMIKNNPHLCWSLQNFASHNINCNLPILFEILSQYSNNYRDYYSILAKVSSKKHFNLHGNGDEFGMFRTYNISHETYFKMLSYSNNLTSQLYEQALPAPWDYYYLSKNKCITFDVVLRNRFMPWNMLTLSLNPNITIDIIISNPEFNWNFKSFSENINLTWEIIKKYPEFPWDFEYISMHPNITMDIIINNPEYDWDYSRVPLNPNCSIEFIKKYPHKSWNILGLFENDLKLDYEKSFNYIKRCDMINNRIYKRICKGKKDGLKYNI